MIKSEDQKPTPPLEGETMTEDLLEKSVAEAKLTCTNIDNEDSFPDDSKDSSTEIKSAVVQPQVVLPTMPPAIPGAQFFMVGPSPQGAYPFQQILIPINPPPGSIVNPQPPTATSNAANPVGACNIGQQFMTLPVSLGVQSAHPVQIFANPQLITNTSMPNPGMYTGGLTGFTMIPTAPPFGLQQSMESNNNQMSAKPDTQLTQGTFFPPMIIPTAGATVIPVTPEINHKQQGDAKRQASSTSDQNAVTSTGGPTSPNACYETLVSNTEPGSVIDGIVMDDIKEFARQFKLRRLSMGLTQSQVGQALSLTAGPAYSQSAICRFEKLDITPKSAQKIKPVLEKWLKEAEAVHRSGDVNTSAHDSTASDRSKKRKRRTSFNPNAIDILTVFFNRKSHPTGAEMSSLSDQLGYDREVIRVWFCNKRQALRNTEKRVKPETSSDGGD